jgi:hypothetical protein
MMTIPAAYAFGWLSFVQLLVVSAVVAAAKIAFNAASGAYLKPSCGRRTCSWPTRGSSPRPGAPSWSGRRSAGRRSACSARSPPWWPTRSATCSRPLGITAIAARKNTRSVPREPGPRLRPGDLLDGWRYILTHPGLRPLFFNNLRGQRADHGDRAADRRAHARPPRVRAVAVRPGVRRPCVGGLIGSRLARRLVARFGRHRVCSRRGTLRACWSLGLAFIRPGAAGLVLVIAVQFGLVTCMGVFNPVFATYRLEHTEKDRIARTLSAWSVTAAPASRP